MAKRKFDLSSDTIDLESSPKSELENESKSLTETKIEDIEIFDTITLRVKKNIKKEFKLWCVENNIQMNDAFVEAWTALKKNTAPTL